VLLLRSVVVMMLFAGVLSTARSAYAQVDPFEFEVYPYQTIGKGVAELESLNSFVPNGHSHGDEGTSGGDYPSHLMYRTAFELSYGLTDRVEGAAYLNLAHPNAASFQYAGSKFRLRGSLFEQGQLPVDLGWYVELEWHRTPQFDGSQLELELRPIIEKNFRYFDLVLNPKFEKAVFLGPDKNKGFEFGYNAGLYYNYRRSFSPGLEFYGGVGLIDDNDPLHAQQHYIFPVVRGEFEHVEYNFGVGVGLTRGSDRVITKLTIAVDRLIGSLL
jgi:hypothetical protein